MNQESRWPGRVSIQHLPNISQDHIPTSTYSASLTMLGNLHKSRSSSIFSVPNCSVTLPLLVHSCAHYFQILAIYILLLESKRLFSYQYKITGKLYICISVLFIYKFFELMNLNKTSYSFDRNYYVFKHSVHFFCKSNYNDHG
jgi:hypothetical protein